MGNIKVEKLEGEEANFMPIWIATSRSEIALQKESRLIKNADRSRRVLMERIRKLGRKYNIDADQAPEPKTDDYDYQFMVDSDLSTGGK